MSIENGTIVQRVKCMSKRARKAILLFTEAVVFCICLLVIVGTYQTVATLPPPVTSTEGSVELVGTHAPGGPMEIVYKVSVKASEETQIRVSRVLEHKETKNLVLLGENYMTYEKGETKVSRLYRVEHLAKGTWCLRATEYWRPVLSLKDHKWTTPDYCFTVKD